MSTGRDCLEGGGEMGALMRAHDWASTPLGAPSGWPAALRTTVGLLLRNRFPLLLWWGPDFIQLYNDAYRPIPGDKHPRSLGQPARECWPEIWHVIGPMIEAPFRGEPAAWSDDLAIFLFRNGYSEETHFKVAYSPVPDDTVPGTGIGGVLATVSEITGQVYAERQLRTLRELGVRVAATSTDDALAAAAATLADNRADVPFALLYTLDGDALRLAAATDAIAGAPRTVSLAGGDAADPLSLRAALARRTTVIVDDVAAQLGDAPASPWGARVHRAVALPLAAAEHEQCYGVMVAGTSPHRPLDEQYGTFLELAASQVVTGIRNARAHEDARRRAEALAEIDRAKTAFFSNVSHELRTPLALMLGPTEDALAGGGALAGDALAMVHRNELRLLKLVNSLLDFARIEAGRIEASYEETELAAVTADLASTFRAAIDKAGLRLVVDAPAPVIGYVDREMWEKIVLNLLSNAFKHTFDGAIEVRVRGDGERIVLAVADTGVGIPADELPHVFERFHRVRNAKGRSHEGSGIGLALVRDLVALHGGTVEVTSELGAGTTFTIAIPAGRAHLAADRVAVAKTLAPTSASSAFVTEAWSWLASVPPTRGPAPRRDRDVRIVLADDNADMREYVARLLGEHWTVDAFGNGADALAAIRAAPPDLVITDVMMPELDGFGLLAALRADARTATTPVILLSARAGEESAADGLRAGADDYIVKPFTAANLLVRVQAQLATARVRRAALAAAAAERRRLQLLLVEAPAAVCVLRGPELVVEFANPRQLAMWGGTAEDIGKPLVVAHPELAGRPILDRLRDVMASGLPVIGEEKPARIDVNRDGTPRDFYFDYMCAPIRDADGTMSVLVFAVDVTQKVTARHQLEAALDEARTANRAKDEFFALLGHELRNPLAPIVSALDLARLRGYTGVARECEVIERQTSHLRRLVDDLMDVSRIAHGKIELQLEPVELGEVIASAVELALPLFERKRHRLAIDVAAGLVVRGDRQRLAQVFVNLLVNAAKYTDESGEIAVHGRADGDRAIVRVRDSGAGITPDMLPRVFDMFVQERQTIERAAGGLGLGLSIVKSLVAQHGGTVTAASAGRGAGSTFEVSLPLASAAARSHAPPGAPLPGPTASSRRILIVEDNDDAAHTLGSAMRALGHQIRIATDGPTALAIAPAFGPELALLDLGLPRMDGYQIATRLRAIEELRDLRVVAVTGYGQVSDHQRTRASGFDAHVVKPVSLDKLASLIDALFVHART